MVRKAEPNAGQLINPLVNEYSLQAERERGIRQAVERVTATGVFIEGNSILDFIQANLVLMVPGPAAGR